MEFYKEVDVYITKIAILELKIKHIEMHHTPQTNAIIIAMKRYYEAEIVRLKAFCWVEINKLTGG